MEVFNRGGKQTINLGGE